MNQTALLPRVIERLGDLLNDMERLIDRNPAFAKNPLPDGFPGNVSHCHIADIVFLADREGLHQVDMAEFCGGARFVQKVVDSLMRTVFR